ncbi:MotA/TolQ/ExbB proton channel family protein [Pontiella sp.]|uniref:MotA/TolQ/ExbB proton channel family protein n=1 Tax=Pontiella sp. TaxID=2837462 RepID=UPI003566E78A
MKTKIKPIVSWSLWAGGLSLVMGFITRKQLIAGFQADETGMSIVIATFFGAGLVLSFLAAKKLHAEWDVLAKITLTGAIPETGGKQGIAAVFQKLEALKNKGETVNVHTAIDTYHSKHNSRVRVVSIMAALIISMGLLGTVVGLIISIAGLGDMVESIGLSKTSMMDAMRVTFDGMGTAFYTTFFGALGGLVLRAVAVSQLNALSELCAEAAEYADNNLVAKLNDKESEINRQVSQIVAAFGAMQREIEAVTASLSQSFETTLQGFGNALAEAGNHALAATKESIDGMTGQMESFNTEIGRSIGLFNGSVETAGTELREAFGGVNSTIAQSGEGLKGAFDGINERLGTCGVEVSNSFNNLNGSVQLAGDTVGESLAEFKLSVDGTCIELNEAIGELRSAIGLATGEMSTVAEARLEAEASSLAGHLSLAAASIQQFISHKSAKQAIAKEKVA